MKGRTLEFETRDVLTICCSYQAAEVASAVQFRGALFPVEQSPAGPEARAITAEEKATSSYMKLRYARSAARTLGAREKRIRDKAEEEANKVKKQS